jgi:hypothetical protein
VFEARLEMPAFFVVDDFDVAPIPARGQFFAPYSSCGAGLCDEFTGSVDHACGELRWVAVRQYFPKNTNLTDYSQSDLNKVALRLNQRPRQTLGFETPASKRQESVASTH